MRTGWGPQLGLDLPVIRFQPHAIGKWCAECVVERGVVDLREIREAVDGVATHDVVDPAHERDRITSMYPSERHLSAGFDLRGTIRRRTLGALLVQLEEAGGDGMGTDAATVAGSDEVAEVTGEQDSGHEATAFGVGSGGKRFLAVS